MKSMQVKEILEAKRDGREHDADTIRRLVSEFTDGTIKDYQMAAWLMAVFFRGLSSRELSTLTEAMWKSGESVPRQTEGDYWIDKHSTGGVGDKPSLILVPLVISAARRLFGPGKIRIPMISGRGLGHSGGTLDKLESVPGFSPRLTLEDAVQLLGKNDYFMMGQTEKLAPADRLLYALRDVTGTVDCLPLIVASILSKKLAESLDGLVLDVKFGSGAFMRTREEGKRLATQLLDIAKAQGVESVALLTRMDEPLGFKVGNLLEVEESRDFLKGTRREAGLYEVTITLATWMLRMGSRRSLSVAAAEDAICVELDSSRPLAVFREMFEAQGGRFAEFEKRSASFRSELLKYEWKASEAGRLQRLEPRPVGTLLNALGGGRNAKEDQIDPRVGFELNKKVGDEIRAGETIITVYHRSEGERSLIDRVLSEAVNVGGEAVKPSPWVVETIL